ncbi:MAG: site-specific integrase [Clostridia bacterium]|nr:site-specific integrase [Clostridia bacterium]
MPKKKQKNANGEGTIYECKSGRHKGKWIAQVTIGLTEDGKPKRKSIYGRTRTEVKEKLKIIMEELSKGIDLQAQSQLSFGNWLLTWMDEYKRMDLRLFTWENYQRYIQNHIYPSLGHVMLKSLDTDHIQKLYNRMHQSEKAPASIRKVHQIINSCLEKAVEKKLLSWNPAKATNLPKLNNTEAKAMSEVEMDKFLDVIVKEPPKWNAAFLTLLGSGLRIGELLALEWNDIDLDNELLYIRRTLSRTKSKGLVLEEPKTQKSKRPVPLPEPTVEAIKKHQKTQREIIMAADPDYKNRNLVFGTDIGTHIYPRNFNRKYYLLREKAGVSKEITLHGLRYQNLNKIQTF